MMQEREHDACCHHDSVIVSVSRLGTLQGSVTVGYVTKPGSAKAKKDYEPTVAGTITFEHGQEYAQIVSCRLIMLGPYCWFAVCLSRSHIDHSLSCSIHRLSPLLSLPLRTSTSFPLLNTGSPSWTSTSSCQWSSKATRFWAGWTKRRCSCLTTTPTLPNSRWRRRRVSGTVTSLNSTGLL